MRFLTHTYYHFRRNWERYIYAAAFIIFAAIGALFGAYRGDNFWTRAAVFFLVTAVLIAELVAMVGRTHPEKWDALGASMAFFRCSVANYMISLAFTFGNVNQYPEWWWTASRTVMGLFAAIALFFMVIEDWKAWGEMDNAQKWRAVVFPFIYIGVVSAIALIW
jgi:hypothetical protein